MATLKNVQAGWKGLQDVINRIIDTVNSQTPVEGSGINIEDSPKGKIISLANQTGSGGGGDSSQTNAGAGGGNLVAVTIQAFDSGNKPVTLTVMTDGSGFGTSTLVWQPVAVVDPATCVQSTITVLEKPTS